MEQRWDRCTDTVLHCFFHITFIHCERGLNWKTVRFLWKKLVVVLPYLLHHLCGWGQLCLVFLLPSLVSDFTCRWNHRYSLRILAFFTTLIGLCIHFKSELMVENQKHLCSQVRYGTASRHPRWLGILQTFEMNICSCSYVFAMPLFMVFAYIVQKWLCIQLRNHTWFILILVYLKKI